VSANLLKIQMISERLQHHVAFLNKPMRWLNTSTQVQSSFPLQPHKVPGIGELALGSLMLGASNTLLNADHFGVYFKGMPLWNGKVDIQFSFMISWILEYWQLSFSLARFYEDMEMYLTVHLEDIIMRMVVQMIQWTLEESR